MKILLAILTLTITACGHVTNGTLEPQGCQEASTPDDARPDLLVIGDSISIGYTPYVRAQLSGYDVSHNPCNAQSSRNGIIHIDEWLAMRPTWDAITFNHGIWDSKLSILTPPQEYEANLRAIVIKVKARTQKPLFVLSTEALPGTPNLTEQGILALNQIAIQVMTSEGIPVLDLHAVSTTIPQLHKNPKDVHYTAAGYQVLSAAVLAELDAQYGVR